MQDLINVRLSKAANDIAENLVATGLFDFDISAAKFALAYAIKNHFNEIDPATYPITDSGGNNYGVGSVDGDGQIAMLLRALYPGLETPYVYARAFMIFGLIKLGERIDREGLQTISALM